MTVDAMPFNPTSEQQAIRSLSDDWEGYPLRKDYPVDTPLAPYR